MPRDLQPLHLEPEAHRDGVTKVTKVAELNPVLSGSKAPVIPVTDNLAFLYCCTCFSQHAAWGWVKYHYLLSIVRKARLVESNDLLNATQPAIYAWGPPTKSSDS